MRDSFLVLTQYKLYIIVYRIQNLHVTQESNEYQHEYPVWMSVYMNTRVLMCGTNHVWFMGDMVRCVFSGAAGRAVSSEVLRQLL